MAVVIGAGTTVTFNNSEYCVISANWGLNPNTQRLYCIGSWVPYLSIDKPTQTLNLTIYAPGPAYTTLPTNDCANANQIQAAVDPRICGDSYEGVDAMWFVSSYSYSKEDTQMPGQESWSLVNYFLNLESDPTYVLRGIAEGTATPNAGVKFSSISTSVTTGSVSAGSFGRADTLDAGTVEEVGGGAGIAAGETGQGSVSIPYNPLYI